MKEEWRRFMGEINKFEAFQKEMRRVEAMRKVQDCEHADYWVGYLRGLRRNYHGEDFGNEGEHEIFLEKMHSPYPRQQQLGKGYRDGLTFILSEGKCVSEP